MKWIEAIIKPSRLEDVKDALHKIGVQGMTVSEVKGFGRQGGHKEIYRGSEREVDFVPKTRIEIATTDDMAEQIIQTLSTAARNGKIGDGKIFVGPLHEVVRIRTGERGEEAI